MTSASVMRRPTSANRDSIWSTRDSIMTARSLRAARPRLTVADALHVRAHAAAAPATSATTVRAVNSPRRSGHHFHAHHVLVGGPHRVLQREDGVHGGD